MPPYKVASATAEQRCPNESEKKIVEVVFSLPFLWFTAVRLSTSAPGRPPSCPSSASPPCEWTSPWPRAAAAGSQFPPANRKPDQWKEDE